MRDFRLIRFVLAFLLLGAVAEVASQLFAQRRGGARSRGSISRYRGSGYNRSYNKPRNYQRGSVRNYQNNYGFPVDNRKGNRSTSRASTRGSQSSRQSLSSQDLPSRSERGSATASQQRSEPRGQDDGTRTRETARGGTVEVSKTTEGNQTTLTTDVTTAGGRTATGTRTATRDGDTIKVESQQHTGGGASRQTSSEIKLDDGRVEKVKRETEATGRYGESIERESEFKRDDGVIKYEGKTETSTGREMETEAEIFRTVGGGVGAVGEVDTKYWGNYDFAHGRGPRGRGTVVYGPYGGTLVTGLPNGARRVTAYGYPYYNYGYYYYYPYYWGGAYYYSWVYPPYGSYYWYLPPGYATVYVGGASYYYHDQVYYQQTYKEGKVAYKVTEAPSGAQVTSLPEGSATVLANGNTYYYYGNTFYRQVEQAGKKTYVVIRKPAGLTTVKELPSEFEPIPVGAATFFKIEDQYYLPFLDGKEQVFVLVSPPQAARKTTSIEQVSTEKTVPAGTKIQIRTADDLNTGKNKSGDSYAGFLNSDLVVEGKTVAPAGSKVHGTVGKVERAGMLFGKARLKLQLVDLVVGHRIYPISTESLEIDGKKSRTLLKIGGGAAVGAAVGAIADGGEGAAIGAAAGAAAGTAVAAASGGKQVKIEAQTLLEFALNKPVTLYIASSPAD